MCNLAKVGLFKIHKLVAIITIMNSKKFNLVILILTVVVLNSCRNEWKSIDVTSETKLGYAPAIMDNDDISINIERVEIVNANISKDKWVEYYHESIHLNLEIAVKNNSDKLYSLRIDHPHFGFFGFISNRNNMDTLRFSSGFLPDSLTILPGKTINVLIANRLYDFEELFEKTSDNTSDMIEILSNLSFMYIDNESERPIYFDKDAKVFSVNRK